jgi:hypothetical protein
MPTYIKTGYWDKKAKAPDGWLDLNLFVQTIVPPSTNIYNSDGILTGNRTISGDNKELIFNNLNRLQIQTNAGAFVISKGVFPNVSTIQTSNAGTQITLNAFNQLNSILNTTFFVNQSLIKSIYGGNDIGLKLDFANTVYQFGQLTGGNTTQLKIDDAAAFPVQVSGTNVSQNTSGTASGKFLKIKVDGVDYAIELKNPS